MHERLQWYSMPTAEEAYWSQALGSCFVVVYFRGFLARELMAAASVGPYIGKGNFAGSPLLEEELVFPIEQEDTECSV